MYISVNSHSVEHDSYTFEQFTELLTGLQNTAPKTFQIKGTSNIFTVVNIGIVVLITKSTGESQIITTLTSFNDILDVINKHPNIQIKLRIILNGTSKDIIRDTHITNTIVFDNNPQKIWGCKTYTSHILNNSVSIIFSDISLMYHFFDQLKTALTTSLVPDFDARFKTQNLEHFISSIQEIVHTKIQKSRLIDIFLFVIRSQQESYKKTFQTMKTSEKQHKQIDYMFPHMLHSTLQARSKPTKISCDVKLSELDDHEKVSGFWPVADCNVNKYS